MVRIGLILVFFVALAEAGQSVEVAVKAPGAPQHWDCGVRGALVIRNDGDADARVVVDFEAGSGWRVAGFGGSVIADPFETIARAGVVSKHWFRLASPGPRRDARVELRLRVEVDGREKESPPPTDFAVTSLGEALCH